MSDIDRLVDRFSYLQKGVPSGLQKQIWPTADYGIALRVIHDTYNDCLVLRSEINTQLSTHLTREELSRMSYVEWERDRLLRGAVDQLYGRLFAAWERARKMPPRDAVKSFDKTMNTFFNQE